MLRSTLSRYTFSLTLTLLILCLQIAELKGAPVPTPPLISPPLGDRWFSIEMNGEKVGFGHTSISRTPAGYTVSSEGSVKLLVMGFSRNAAARETYNVDSNLALCSFNVEQTIDNSRINISGVVSNGFIKMKEETKVGVKEKSIRVKGAVYPPPLINLYPLMKGFKPGRVYNPRMFDTETGRLKEVQIRALGVEKRGGMELFHFRNNLYPLVDNDIWIDIAGNTLEESVRDGLVVTRAENPDRAVASLMNDAIAKKDLVFDFSLIKLDRELPDSESIDTLVLELSGYPDNYPPPAGPGQKALREPGNRLILTMTAPLRQTGSSSLSAVDRERYLAATRRINSDNREIIDTLGRITASGTASENTAKLLSSWVGNHLEDTVTDSYTAFEALKLGKGNCQSHARLYVALARAAGIPSRMVSGLVHVKGKGFLYHSWAESHLEGWVSIDPTFGQFPADVTHIRLVEGDEPEDMAPLAGLIGRLKIRVVQPER